MANWYNPFSWFGGGGDDISVGIQSPLSSKRSAAVTFDSAMSVSAYWASVRLVSEVIAAMPLKAYDVSEDGKQQDTDYSLWRILNYSPNRYQTRTEFFEQMTLNLTSWGNAYAAIERNSRGEVISLMPLPASQIIVDLLEDGSITYTFTTTTGVRVYSEQSIWHVKLFGNGIIGLSPLSYASNSISTTLNTNNRIRDLAANGGKPAGLLTIDKVLTPEQRKAVKENFKHMREGDPDGLFVLEAGMKYDQISLSPTDLQLLETRKYQVEDVARFMGVPSVLINDTSGTTTWGSGIQQIMDGFYKLNLRPYLERYESSLKKHLMPRSDWETKEIEFDFDSILRADKLTRMDANSRAINSGQLTPNEARRDEGLTPMAGGDKIYLNGTLVPAESTGLNGNEETPNAD
jgi:HK97 family phage portal protein